MGNNRRNFNVDYSQPGQLATQQQLAQMLQNAQQQYQRPTTINVEPTSVQTQPVNVNHTNSPAKSTSRVPEIYVPVTDYWRAHRFHPHNNLRYFWYIFYWLKDAISSPVGIATVMLWLGFGGINFLLNGNYSGPGYMQKQYIKVTPENLPNLTSVVDLVD